MYIYSPLFHKKLNKKMFENKYRINYFQTLAIRKNVIKPEIQLIVNI